VKPGKLRFSNSPEVFSAPDFVDTQEFEAENMTHIVLEAYYQKGPFWFASEQMYVNVKSKQTRDPVFKSFFAQATWALNGKSRPYNQDLGYFGVLRPNAPFWNGGKGILEVGTRYSKVDLTEGTLLGGEMSRLTGIFNWFWASNVLSSFNYGLVRLDREKKIGYTNIFQLRIFMAF
jgi:phosphate-selective porin OprO/OprP